LLRAVDLPERICEDYAGYEEKAVSLALQRDKVEALKRKLVDNRMSCILFDSPRFVRDLEDRFEQVALKGDASAQPKGSTSRRTSKSNLPLVSILMPTHNRPDYAEDALKSILAQSWDNLEIVISDNSDDELTAQRFAPYIAANPNIRYLRSPGLTALENFENVYRASTGEFVNYLMDDDLYHPTKIERMMGCMLARPNIGLVTSFRQLIDAEGRFMAPITGTERLFESDTVIGGASLGDMILTNGQNMIGEPTTAMFRRSAVGPKFGNYLGRQYVTLSDVATWLSVLKHMDCVYLPDALSYFRIHGGQDQRNNRVRIEANVEWLQLLCDSHEQGTFMKNRVLVHELLTNKLVTCIWFLSSVHTEIKQGVYPLEKIQSVIRQATNILLGK
jgi:glycosyltransferase involved in cell wall biosynthesis